MFNNVCLVEQSHQIHKIETTVTSIEWGKQEDWDLDPDSKKKKTNKANINIHMEEHDKKY